MQLQTLRAGQWYCSSEHAQKTYFEELLKARAVFCWSASSTHVYPSCQFAAAAQLDIANWSYHKQIMWHAAQARPMNLNMPETCKQRAGQFCIQACWRG